MKRGQMFKLQILSDKGDITFHIDQKRKILPFLSFPRAAILDFMTSLRCPIVWGQRTDVIKFKMAARGKFKNDNLVSFLS